MLKNIILYYKLCRWMISKELFLKILLGTLKTRHTTRYNITKFTPVYVHGLKSYNCMIYLIHSFRNVTTFEFHVNNKPKTIYFKYVIAFLFPLKATTSI